MTTPEPSAPGPQPPPSADPTVRVARPPVPGPANPAGVGAARSSPAPGSPDDEPTVGLPGRVPKADQRTLQFGTPAPVKVTVSPRPRRRRRYRTWPWIAGVVVALLVLGTILLVMLLRGETIDAGTDLVGDGARGTPVSTAPILG